MYLLIPYPILALLLFVFLNMEQWLFLFSDVNFWFKRHVPPTSPPTPTQGFWESLLVPGCGPSSGISSGSSPSRSQAFRKYPHGGNAVEWRGHTAWQQGWAECESQLSLSPSRVTWVWGSPSSSVPPLPLPQVEQPCKWCRPTDVPHAVGSPLAKVMVCGT